MAFSLSSVARIKFYYLKGVLAVYIIAFTSLYLQVRSLFGDNGIVPLRDYMSKLNTNAKKPLELQSLVALAPKFGLGYGEFLELLCIFGVLLALLSLFVRRLTNALTFGLLWYIYYSISLVGQGFMTFHSDLLLLEVGFITTLLAPLLPTSRMSQSDHDHLTFFLIKWLTFRYFVTNVLNVYLDNDEAWYEMTAIKMVAQGVQFPSRLSWHVFNAPGELAKVYQAYEHVVKLCAPFLMLFDLKYSRQCGFYTLLAVAIPSALFFNFGWTDLLMAVCLLSFLKDAYYYNDKRAKQSNLRTFVDVLVLFAYIATVVFLMVRYFGLKYEKGVLKAQVMFTPVQFKLFADHIVPVSLVFGLLGLLNATYTTYFTSSRRTSIVKTLLYTFIVIPLFFSTFPTLIRFAPGLETKVKPIGMTKELSRAVAPYMLSNNYLLLSKVSHHYGEHRTELQIQGRVTPDDAVWQQFDLRYKPGLPSRELPRVVPHLPRVDLKMWYAARSSLQNNQWLQTLAYRVASQEKDLNDVLAPDTAVPKLSQIRIAAVAYKYSRKDRHPFAGYWSQSKVVSDYMPATTPEHLKFTVKSNGVSLTTPAKKLDERKPDTFNKMVSTYLEIVSEYVRGLDHTIVIWSTFVTAATISIMMK
uniref:Lipase maturation factor n=1 Tax=Aceria tosichella TaxID=561515 RepID=A0A6G1SCM1_9ACAR